MNNKVRAGFYTFGYILGSILFVTFLITSGLIQYVGFVMMFGALCIIIWLVYMCVLESIESKYP